jgi:hypothetical protein
MVVSNFQNRAHVLATKQGFAFFIQGGAYVAHVKMESLLGCDTIHVVSYLLLRFKNKASAVHSDWGFFFASLVKLNLPVCQFHTMKNLRAQRASALLCITQ